MGKNDEAAAAPSLETRHVFLDTQVYHALKHNPANPAFKQLVGHVEERRLVLHTSDITLLEVKRQLHESVAARTREIGAIEKDMRRWRAAAPAAAPAEATQPDVEKLGDALFAVFTRALIGRCRAQVHKAFDIPAATVFQTYFNRLPPFDGEGSKEFPDGFVLQALDAWCEANSAKLYVVSADGAIVRAGAKSKRLIPLKSLHDLLSLATASVGPEIETAFEAAINGAEFERPFEDRLRAGIKDAVFVYTGELPDGEAYEGELVEIIAIRNWTVIGRAGQMVSAILTVEVTARIEVQYEDRSEAMYDNEDGRWWGASTSETQVETEVALPVFVEIDTASGRLVEVQVLDHDVSVTERHEDFD